MTYTAEQLIARYIALRDQRDAIAERHKAELEPVNAGMDVIETALMDMLNAQGGQSIKTGSGTAYRSEILTTKVEDWESFLYWNARFGGNDFLVRQVNKTAVKELLDAGKGLPAGISTDTMYRLNVRRS